MKKNYLFFIAFVLALFSGKTQAQDWKWYTWDDYSTTFKIPEDFTIEKSSGSVFQATNKRITLSIYPRNESYESYEEMESSLLTWARDNGVVYDDLNGIVDLDENKMNGYWGILLEGTASDFPVGLLLIADPDYPDITFYIWVSYYEEEIDTVLEILQSFTPN